MIDEDGYRSESHAQRDAEPGVAADTIRVLRSPLTPAMCVARLRAAIDQDGALSWFGSRPVVGWVSEGSVRLRKRIGYTNSFQTILTGSFEERDGATLFRGQAGIRTLVAAFTAVWFGGIVLFGSAMMVMAVIEIAAGRSHPLAAVFLPVMLLSQIGLVWFGRWLVRYGRWLAQGEEAFLVGFVAEVIAAGPGDNREQV